MLEQIAIFLAAAVFIVPLFKRLGLGTVFGSWPACSSARGVFNS